MLSITMVVMRIAGLYLLKRPPAISFRRLLWACSKIDFIFLVTRIVLPLLFAIL